jgi:hypothetical protein
MEGMLLAHVVLFCRKHVVIEFFNCKKNVLGHHHGSEPKTEDMQFATALKENCVGNLVHTPR